MTAKPNGHAPSDSVGDILVLADATDEPFSEIEAAKSAIILRSQLADLQISAARNAERATIETLAQDAMRRQIEAFKKGDYQTVV